MCRVYSFGRLTCLSDFLHGRLLPTERPLLPATLLAIDQCPCMRTSERLITPRVLRPHQTAKMLTADAERAALVLTAPPPHAPSLPRVNQLCSPSHVAIVPMPSRARPSQSSRSVERPPAGTSDVLQDSLAEEHRVQRHAATSLHYYPVRHTAEPLRRCPQCQRVSSTSCP